MDVLQRTQEDISTAFIDNPRNISFSLGSCWQTRNGNHASQERVYDKIIAILYFFSVSCM